MRIHHEADFAYDLEQPRDPQTQLPLNWRFTVYRLRPMEGIVARGEATTRTGAERKAKSIITRLVAKEGRVAAGGQLKIREPFTSGSVQLCNRARPRVYAWHETRLT